MLQNIMSTRKKIKYNKIKSLSRGEPQPVPMAPDLTPHTQHTAFLLHMPMLDDPEISSSSVRKTYSNMLDRVVWSQE